MAGFLILAIAASCTTLTLALIVGGGTAGSYQQARSATAGPDALAVSFATALESSLPVGRMPFFQ